MKQPKFKEGDWVFCEFILQQIQETEDNRITSVSDGSFRLGSNDLSGRCFPLDMKIKRISDGVKYWSGEFNKLKNNALNYPDLNRELIRRWVDMCEFKDDDKKLKELYDKLDVFARAILDKVNSLRFEEVEGVALFRR